MKQRLIGAIVLGCLALIFIPLLLDGEGIEPRELTLEMPAEPVIERQEMPEPLRPEIVEDTLSDLNAGPGADLSTLPEFPVVAVPAQTTADNTPTQTAVQNAETAASAKADRLPAVSDAGLPQGWVVRLGMFGERRNADALLSDLLKAGYKAYPEAVTSGQGVLTGVFVGPVLTRAEANSLQVELKRRFKLDGLVRQFSLNAQQ